MIIRRSANILRIEIHCFSSTWSDNQAYRPIIGNLIACPFPEYMKFIPKSNQGENIRKNPNQPSKDTLECPRGCNRKREIIAVLLSNQTQILHPELN